MDSNSPYRALFLSDFLLKTTFSRRKKSKERDLPLFKKWFTIVRHPPPLLWPRCNTNKMRSFDGGERGTTFLNKSAEFTKKIFVGKRSHQKGIFERRSPLRHHNEQKVLIAQNRKSKKNTKFCLNNGVSSRVNEPPKKQFYFFPTDKLSNSTTFLQLKNEQ